MTTNVSPASPWVISRSPGAKRTSCIPLATRSSAASGSIENSGIPRSSDAWRSGTTPSVSSRRTSGQPTTATTGSGGRQDQGALDAE